MNRALLKKCIGEAQCLWLACAAALFAFCWFRVWLVSRLAMGQFESIIENFREYERFSPVPFEQLFTYTGRVAMMFSTSAQSGSRGCVVIRCSSCRPAACRALAPGAARALATRACAPSLRRYPRLPRLRGS